MKRWPTRFAIILVALLGAIAQDAPTLVAQRAPASTQKQDPQTFPNLRNAGLGFKRDSVLLVMLNPQGSGYNRAQSWLRRPSLAR
jgi:hypothetical protein